VSKGAGKAGAGGSIVNASDTDHIPLNNANLVQSQGCKRDIEESLSDESDGSDAELAPELKAQAVKKIIQFHTVLNGMRRGDVLWKAAKTSIAVCIASPQTTAVKIVSTV
jgi:hypothetical protein